MPLTALLILGDEDPAFDILGVPVCEFQMRRAVAAGARHIVILVQRMPASLHAAADALRRDRISVDIARSVADAVEFVHPEDRVLVVSLHCVPMAAAIAELCAQPQAAVLTIDRAAPYPQLEIIDPLSRWTGYALLDGVMLRQTTAAIGDWDLGSVVLRSLVQRHAIQVRIDPADAIMMLETRGAARALGRRLIAEQPPAATGLSGFWLIAPMARWLAQVIGERGIRDVWSERAALLLCLVALIFAITGWIALPLALLVLAIVTGGSAIILRAATGTSARWPFALDWVVHGSAAAIMLSTGFALMRTTGQWGCIVLAIALVGMTALTTSYRRPFGHGTKVAEPDLLVIMVALAAMFGAPLLGLLLAVLAAAASVAVMRFHGRTQA